MKWNMQNSFAIVGRIPRLIKVIRGMWAEMWRDQHTPALHWLTITKSFDRSRIMAMRGLEVFACEHYNFQISNS